MELLLDGNKIANKEELYKILKEQINSEDFCGSNLDALWDALLYCSDTVVLTIKNKDQLEKTFGIYYTELMKVFTDLKESNIDITINEV